jgi:hypothetical protein
MFGVEFKRGESDWNTIVTKCAKDTKAPASFVSFAIEVQPSIPGMGQTHYRWRSIFWPIPRMLATKDARGLLPNAEQSPHPALHCPSAANGL